VEYCAPARADIVINVAPTGARTFIEGGYGKVVTVVVLAGTVVAGTTATSR
jgi:hypothetical protein